MIVGILKEIKAEENRVSTTPAGVGSGFEDQHYGEAGAEIAGSITHGAVADALGLEYTSPDSLLAGV